MAREIGGSEIGSAGEIDEKGEKFEIDEARAKKCGTGDESLTGGSGPVLVEDEIAVGIEDGDVVVDFHWLNPVRMVAKDKIGAGVDGEVSEVLLARSGSGGVFLAPVELDHDDVGLGAGRGNVGGDVFIGGGGDGRGGTADLVEAQKSKLDSPTLDKSGVVEAGDAKAGGGEKGNGLVEAGTTVIKSVVVGKVDDVDTGKLKAS